MADKNLRFEGIGGQLNPTERFYGIRKHDEYLYQRLLARRGIFAIVSSRQTGKTSSCIYVANQLQEKPPVPHHSVFIDLGELFGFQPSQEIKSQQGWFSALFRKIAELTISATASEVNIWLSERADNGFGTLMLTDFFTDFIRPKINGTINFFIDEIDVTRSYHTHTDELFYGISRLGKQAQALDMSFIFVGTTAINDLLKVYDASVINNVDHIVIKDFTEKEIIEQFSTNAGLNKETGQPIGKQVYIETGGQPYLTSWLYSEVVEHSCADNHCVSQIAADFVNGIKSFTLINEHFSYSKEVLLSITDSGVHDALNLFQKLRDKPIKFNRHDESREAVGILKRIGLVRADDKDTLYIKGNIYHRYMDEDWVDAIKKSIGTTPTIQRIKNTNGKAENRPRVCILNIGGMINMELRPDGSVGEPSSLVEYLSDIPELHEIAEITPIPMFSKDSSEVTPEDWAEVAKAIYKKSEQGFNGFVITGGTDTLPSIASALAFALGPGLRFPVICTGAQVPRHVLHGDARINLIRACKLATYGTNLPIKQRLPEVIILSNDSAFRAVRTEKKDDYRFDAFHSPTLDPIATIADDIKLAKHIRRLPPRRIPLECNAEFETDICKIQFYPGLKSEIILPILKHGSIRGLIIETPGAGILPLHDKYSLSDVLDYCGEKGIPVLLLSQHPTQEALAENYEPAQGATKRSWVLNAPNMSPTAATVKFMWLLAQYNNKTNHDGEDDTQNWIKTIFDEMKADYVGELDEHLYED